MRRTARVWFPSFFLGAGLFALAPGSAGAAEPDQFEERMLQQGVERFTQRTFQTTRTERAMWLKILETAYGERVTDKITKAATEEDYGAWFDLLAGKNGDWRKEDAPTPQVGHLFDSVAQRLELGPVQYIKREEFLKIVKRGMLGGAGQAAQKHPQVDLSENAAKVFRVLDKDGDGELTADELTVNLKEDRLRADADGNGRISKEEYRDWFKQKAEARAEAQIAKWGAFDGFGGGKGKGGKGDDKLGANGLPEWFATLDIDKDKQISLFEWREGGRPLEVFQEMDLDADGLLTRDEYVRYRKKKQEELEQKRREEGK